MGFKALFFSIESLPSLLPLWFKSYFVPSNHHQSSGRAFVTSILLCFGAGVLLATALVHMLPEVRVQEDNYLILDLRRQLVLS